MYGPRLHRVPIDEGLTEIVDVRYPAIRGASARARMLGLTGDDPALTVSQSSVHWPSDTLVAPALQAAAQLRSAVRAQIQPKMVTRQPQRGILLR